jgi:hypothetical protein
MAKAPLSPQQRRQNDTKSLTGNIQYGMDNGGLMGGLMGFMGLPYWARDSGTAPWQQMWPGGVAPGMGGNGGGGGGNPQIEDPALPPYDPNNPNAGGGQQQQQDWTFPQYSQTWAFTPPAPTPYPDPQPFDPKKYGNPFAKKY